MTKRSCQRFFFLVVFSLVAVSLPLKGQDSSKVAEKIIAFCNAEMGKKVGKGECWDLAKEALNYSGANWTPPYGFGRKLTKDEVVLPGDIVQFENAKIAYPDNSWVLLPHHTAIVYKISGPNQYILVEQNSNNKRFLITSEINLNYLKRGTIAFFRPQ